jgi:hypothetical protein
METNNGDSEKKESSRLETAITWGGYIVFPGGVLGGKSLEMEARRKNESLRKEDIPGKTTLVLYVLLTGTLGAMSVYTYVHDPEGLNQPIGPIAQELLQSAAGFLLGPVIITNLIGGAMALRCNVPLAFNAAANKITGARIYQKTQRAAKSIATAPARCFRSYRMRNKASPKTPPFS